MWQRFTENARKVIFHAQEVAQSFGDGHVSTEHLLLGLLREPDCHAVQVLVSLEVNLPHLQADVERQLPRSKNKSSAVDLTPRAKRVIDLAYDESRFLGNKSLCTEHLLIGLIREANGIAGRALERHGVILEDARNEVRRITGGPDAPATGTMQGFLGRLFSSRWPVQGKSRRLTESAKKVLIHAETEAKKFGEGSVSTEHLLLGILCEPGCVAARLLVKLGVSAEQLRSEVESYLPPGGNWDKHEMSLTPRAKWAMDLANDESRKLIHNHLGTEHLLLGLLREGDGYAGRALTKLGVKLDRVREEWVGLIDNTEP